MKKGGLSFRFRGILWLLTGFLFTSFLIPSLVHAGTATIGNYVLVSKTRVGRTAYDYVYRASLTNGNVFDLKNAQATFTSKVSSTQVIDGSLTIGNVSVGGTVSSSDTFTLRINLTSTFKASDLVWTVTYDPPVGVHITSPSTLAVIDGNKATVEGTYVGYTNDVGVTVNGKPAIVRGNSFVADDVPLSAGSNPVKAVITTFDGIQNSDEISLTASGTIPSFELWANVISGVPPLEVNFRPEVNGIEPVEYRYDFDGNGVADITATDSDSVSFAYSAPGIYQAKVTATDAGGEIYIADKTIVVEDLQVVNEQLTRRWTAFTDGLKVQDVEGSLGYLIPESRPKYREMFNALSSQLPAIFSSVSPPQLIMVQGNLAQFRVQREQAWEGVPRTITYYLWFVRDNDGLWKLDRF